MTPDKKVKIRKFVSKYRVEIGYGVAVTVGIVAAVVSAKHKVNVLNENYKTFFVTVRTELVPEFEPRFIELVTDFGISYGDGKNLL